MYIHPNAPVWSRTQIRVTVLGGLDSFIISLDRSLLIASAQRARWLLNASRTPIDILESMPRSILFVARLLQAQGF